MEIIVLVVWVVLIMSLIIIFWEEYESMRENYGKIIISLKEMVELKGQRAEFYKKELAKRSASLVLAQKQIKIYQKKYEELKKAEK
jgi:hypothetical protein